MASIDHSQYLQKFFDHINAKGTWADRKLSSLGTIIADIMAGFSADQMYHIDACLRAAFPHKTNRLSSIYAAARFLGVVLTRRSPAAVSVDLYNNTGSAITLPRFSTFNIAGHTFYTDDFFSMLAGERRTVNLLYGIPATQQFVSQGIPFKPFKLGHEGFVVAQGSLEITTEDPVTGEVLPWSAYTDSLFNLAASDRVYHEYTDEAGDAVFMFGDNTYGKLPAAGQRIRVAYVTTNGVMPNVVAPGTTVYLSTNKQLSGVTLTAPEGGSLNKSWEYYQLFSPGIARSNLKMITQPDWVANIALYPGVADVCVQAQRDIAPDDPRWRSVVRVCILPDFGSWSGTNPNPISPQWTEFLQWASTKIGNVEIQTWNPLPVYTDLEVDVFIHRHASKQEIQDALVAAMQTLFARKPKTLGRRLARSDIDAKMRDVPESVRTGIDYYNIRIPRDDVVPNSKLEYVALRELKINVRYTDR